MHGYARSCPSPGPRITAATLGTAALAGDATAVPGLVAEPARHPALTARAGNNADRHWSQAPGGAFSPVKQRGPH
jgi:hypothetical protein